jgi:uncharacterized protein with HEPN domain
MSNLSDYARVKFVLKMIENIETIIIRHDTILDTLEDEVEVKPAYDVRNFVAHNYEGVNIGLVALLLEDNIPSLKVKFIKILTELKERD